MNTEQKFGLVNQQFGIIWDAIKNTQADVNSLSANTSALDQLSDVNINSAVNGDTLVYNSTTSEWVNSATSAEVPLTFSTGLTRTTNTITNNLSTGVASGQTAIGGTGVTDILKLKGTTGNGTLGSPAIQAIVGNNGATTALTVLNSGNVGIGTTAPAYPLDVNGSAKMTTIRDNANSIGTSGQLLSSTGSVLSWVSPSGGSLGVSVLTETKTAGVGSSVAFPVGTSTQKRQLNTVNNSSGLTITLTGTPDWNFTIPTAGTYLFKGRAFIRSNVVDSQQLYSKLVLNNQSLGFTSVIVGDSSYFGGIHSSNIFQNFVVHLDGIYTITGITVFSLDQITGSPYQASSGGIGNGLGGYTETFASLVITKIA